MTPLRMASFGAGKSVVLPVYFYVSADRKPGAQFKKLTLLALSYSMNSVRSFEVRQMLMYNNSSCAYSVLHRYVCPECICSKVQFTFSDGVRGKNAALAASRAAGASRLGELTRS